MQLIAITITKVVFGNHTYMMSPHVRLESPEFILAATGECLKNFFGQEIFLLYRKNKQNISHLANYLLQPIMKTYMCLCIKRKYGILIQLVPGYPFLGTSENHQLSLWISLKHLTESGIRLR